MAALLSCRPHWDCHCVGCASCVSTSSSRSSEQHGGPVFDPPCTAIPAVHSLCPLCHGVCVLSTLEFAYCPHLPCFFWAPTMRLCAVCFAAVLIRGRGCTPPLPVLPWPSLSLCWVLCRDLLCLAQHCQRMHHSRRVCLLCSRAVLTAGSLQNEARWPLGECSVGRCATVCTVVHCKCLRATLLLWAPPKHGRLVVLFQPSSAAHMLTAVCLFGMCVLCVS
jgi:hypothetical protein